MLEIQIVSSVLLMFGLYVLYKKLNFKPKQKYNIQSIDPNVRQFQYGHKWHKVSDTLYHKGIGYKVTFIGLDACAVIQNSKDEKVIIGNVKTTEKLDDVKW